MSGEAEVGEVIAGYVLEAPLGSGSTSHVFVGRNLRTGLKAAIKVLARSRMERPEARFRLLQEARAIADIRHPNIVEILEFHEIADPPRLALVMELVEGPTLRALRGDPLGPRAAREVARQLIEAVSTAHRAGVIHRDLKPDNLLFTEDPRHPQSELRLKVVDFGLAKRMGAGGLLETAAGTMLGTPAYMAPEQILGRSPTPATDAYAVGELVYELFTGERAFPEEALGDVVQLKIRGYIPALPMPPPLDRDLAPLLRRYLAPDPASRPDLNALSKALDGLGPRALAVPAGATALADAPVGPHASGPGPRHPRPGIGRHPRLARALWEAEVPTGAVPVGDVERARQALAREPSVKVLEVPDSQNGLVETRLRRLPQPPTGEEDEEVDDEAETTALFWEEVGTPKDEEARSERQAGGLEDRGGGLRRARPMEEVTAESLTPEARRPAGAARSTGLTLDPEEGTSPPEQAGRAKEARLRERPCDPDEAEAAREEEGAETLLPATVKDAIRLSGRRWVLALLASAAVLAATVATVMLFADPS